MATLLTTTIDFDNLNTIERIFIELGSFHASIDVPLTNFSNFFNKMINGIIDDLPETDIEKRKRVSLNRNTCINFFAKGGYLHSSVESFEGFDLSNFSTLSTTSIASSIYWFVATINNAILNEDYSKLSCGKNCHLNNLLESPYINLLFNSEEDKKSIFT